MRGQREVKAPGRRAVRSECPQDSVAAGRDVQGRGKREDGSSISGWDIH